MITMMYDSVIEAISSQKSKTSKFSQQLHKSEEFVSI